MIKVFLWILKGEIVPQVGSAATLEHLVTLRCVCFPLLEENFYVVTKKVPLGKSMAIVLLAKQTSLLEKARYIYP
jgi:hypothetical protein